LSAEESAEHTARVGRIQAKMLEVGQLSMDIWTDLKWIKDNRTYREEYPTFDDFCKTELGKDNSQIYRYLKDAELKERLLLEASSDEERLSIMGLKEYNTRYLRSLPEESVAPLWKVVYGLG